MGPIAAALVADHRRIEALLASPSTFEAGRAALLRHIGIEEKILFRESRRARGGEPLPIVNELRIQHGAIASLLVPTPTPEVVAELRALLDEHDALEEGEGGLYAECDRLLAADAAAIVTRIAAAPEVPAAAHFDGPGVHRTAASALAASRTARRRD